MTTYKQFLTAALQGWGAPVTDGNLQALATIVQFEGRNDYWNPFNVEWHAGENEIWHGVSNYNSVGVQRYADSAHGIAATVAFFEQPHWSGLIHALRTTPTFAAVTAAIKAGYSWATFAVTTPAVAEQILNSVMGGTDATPQSENATPITGGFLMALTDAQQTEVLKTVRALKAAVGLNATQVQHQYNVTMWTYQIVGGLQTSAKASSSAEASQLAAINAQVLKLAPKVAA